MCEFLIRATSKINHNDLYLDCQCTKRGDVIVSRPDGWAWGTDELRHPDYRIMAVPSLSDAEGEALCAPEAPVDPANPSKTLQKRGLFLDVDHPPLSNWPNFADYFADASRVEPILHMPGQSASAVIKQATHKKPPIQDPNAALGHDPHQIG